MGLSPRMSCEFVNESQIFSGENERTVGIRQQRLEAKPRPSMLCQEAHISYVAPGEMSWAAWCLPTGLHVNQPRCATLSEKDE